MTMSSEMGQDDHLRIDYWVEALKRDGAAGMLARRTHDHLVALCEECRRQWQQLGKLQSGYQ